MDCAFNDCFDSETSFYRETPRTARKQHQCCECRQPIETGVTYLQICGKSEGFFSFKSHAECAELGLHFEAHIGQFYEEAAEALFPNLRAGGPCLEGLSAAAKVKLFEMWRKWKGVEA